VSDDNPKKKQPWTAQERASLVLSILREGTSVEEAARDHALTVQEVGTWKDEFLAAAEEALRLHRGDRETLAQEAHDNGLGVWVCVSGQEFLAPCLFIEAVCPDGFPSPASAKWTGPGRPPKPLQEGGEVALLHGECAPESGDKIIMHLYAPKVPVTALFERRTALSDWRFPIEVSGIILLFAKPGERAPARPLLRAPRPSDDRTLAWVNAQHLPFVAAAMGYRVGEFYEEQFRRRRGLPPEIPIVPGPSMTRDRLPRADLSSMVRREPRLIMSLLGRGDVHFDPCYASRLLSTLRGEIHPDIGRS
jgi:hypothetical protein